MFGISKIYRLFIARDRALSRQIKYITGHTPIKLSLYRQAFCHKSSLKAAEKDSHHNERLEYLGDAMLSMIVAEYLFKKYPQQNEGFLTKMRAKIVKRRTLNQIAESMELTVILEQQNNMPVSKSMKGNALEALIGAFYLEHGYEITRNFVIQRILRQFLDIHELEKVDDNFKSQLLEWSQKNGKEICYTVLDQYKIQNRDRFKVAVLVDGKKVAEADDYNKKSAEQRASKKVIKGLKRSSDGAS